MDAFLPSIAQRVAYISLPVAGVVTIITVLAASEFGAMEVIYGSLISVLSIVVLTFLAFDGIFLVRGFAGTPRLIYAAALVGDLVAFALWVGVVAALDSFDPHPWLVLLEAVVVAAIGLALLLRIKWLDRRDRRTVDSWLHSRDSERFRRDETLARLFGIERFETASVHADDGWFDLGAGGFRYHLFFDQRGVLDQWVGRSRGAFLRLQVDPAHVQYVSARSRSGRRGAMVIRPREQTETRFESIDVDERLKIEHEPGTDPIEVTRIFDPVVLDTLASREGVQVELYDGTLVAYRMGPLENVEQVDDLLEVARVFASSIKRAGSEAQPNSRSAR